MNYRSSVNDVIDRENKRRARSIFFFFRAVSLCAFHDSAYLWLFIPLLSVSSVFFSPDCSPFLLLWVAFILVLRERVLSCFLALSSQNFFFLYKL